MKILALEPYYGGSHRAFLDGWIEHSRHDWELLTLPPHNWKWRMRHSALTFANEVAAKVTAGRKWDALFCTDMLNLAEFKGLAPETVTALPTIAYFHENQLTYPVRNFDERDIHFGLINFSTASAADAVWFNSQFHLDSFTAELTKWLKNMPDFQLSEYIDRLKARAAIYPQGIYPAVVEAKEPGIPTILWVARWEHDKNPALFFDAVRSLKAHGSKFRLSVIGQSFSQVPEVFETARRELYGFIHRWGFQEKHEEYLKALDEAHIVVSTAEHEFFGVSILEAISAGVYPLLPDRLAYPELIEALQVSEASDYLYDGTLTDLITRLVELLERHSRHRLWPEGKKPLAERAKIFYWPNLAPRLDSALEDIATRV
jgi:glycosyltransferase involved in cell wall biosynthesis